MDSCSPDLRAELKKAKRTIASLRKRLDGTVKSMTPVEFAKKCGVTIVECKGRSYDGPYCWVDPRYPNSMIGGYRTEASAYRGFIESEFEGAMGQVVKSLLLKPKRVRKQK